MKKGLMCKSVIIIGASGGLGAGFAKAFADSGARLLLVARNKEKLKLISDQITGDITITSVDVTDAESVEKLAEFAKGWSESIDIVVNVSGYDVRKSLDEHNIEDIRNTLEINLLGAMLITKSLLSCMKNRKGSTIVNVGGFADGRMAFPYYCVDAASRAGLYTFIEAINRELELEGRETRVTYFCPSPADTEAERPFHSLWRKMGISIVPVEKVAKALLKTIEKKKTIGIMGGFTTVLFAKLNSVFPKLADVIVMKTYGKMLREFLYGSKEASAQKPKKQKSSRMDKIAFILVVFSFILYGLIFIVPFLPVTLAQKAVVISVLVASGEITWWVGIAIVGKQVVEKYRKYFNPCNWFSCKSAV